MKFTTIINSTLHRDTGVLSRTIRWTSRGSVISWSSFSSQCCKRVEHIVSAPAQEQRVTPSGLSRLPTTHLLRNILLAGIFSSPILQRSSLAVLRVIANSKSAVLNPDKNAVLRAIIKPILYKQFCAGTSPQEICRTRDENKRMGYSGVGLCYGKELQLNQDSSMSKNEKAARDFAEIQHFKNMNLNTIDMIGAGDWLAIKYTGAGCLVSKALVENSEMPADFRSAMEEICKAAATKGVRVWIDAEQQCFQKGIDDWTIGLMRKFNGKEARVYTTHQAYLKSAPRKLQSQLQLAQSEGFVLGVKLVRGAYIGTEARECIHDTKEETDKCYNGIVHSLLSGHGLGFAPETFPKIGFLVCGHNPYSVSNGWQLVQDLEKQGQLKVNPDFAMLQGMGDTVACQVMHQVESRGKTDGNATLKIYKLLTWGSVQECMQYLYRRAIENSGGPDRMKDGLRCYHLELRRRIRKAVCL